MFVTFYGAAQMVTGSKHILDIDGKVVLLDCGMFQGSEEDMEKLNRELPMDPQHIDYIVLSHAHIDHSGLIPYFVKKGFAGKVICTLATKDLATILLEDSGGIQEHDAEFINKKIERHHLDRPKKEPLYTVEDAKRALEFFHGVNYNTEYHLTENVVVSFRDAGHILGSAIVEIVDKKDNKTLVFTGDLGRHGLPILQDPYQVEKADYLITESTYGNRTHDDVSTMMSDIEMAVNETINNGGKLIIPAFSVGRTQEIVVILHELWDQKRIPKVPIYVDSPLSTEATDVFMAHPECYDKETFQNFLMNQHNPFNFGNLKYIQKVEDSIALNNSSEPSIIISASGMCENGRILHHLKRALPDHRNTVLIIGYMARGTLGRRLVDGDTEVTIHGKPRLVKAKIKVLNSFSAHADKEELFQFARDIQGLKQVFLVHGEPEQQDALATRMREELPGVEVHIPAKGDRFSL